MYKQSWIQCLTTSFCTLRKLLNNPNIHITHLVYFCKRSKIFIDFPKKHIYTISCKPLFHIKGHIKISKCSNIKQV